MAAAGKTGGGDDLLSPNGENVENHQLLGLGGENVEETSDVSASLFKEISSEEEIEVLSGTRHGTAMGGGILGMNGVGNAPDSEAETSGEDGSLFEEIGGDDSHFVGLGGVQQSAYDRAANGNNGAAAGYILGGSLRFQTEDVPFIRAARGDLDGPLDGPLASLRREGGASLHTFEEKLSSIFEDLRAKEESSSLAGICRDYASSSGEEGGVDAVSVILIDSNGEGEQVSYPVNGQETKIKHVQEAVEVLMIPMEQGTHVKTVSGITLEETQEVSRLPLTTDGKNPTPLNADEVADGGVSKAISSSPKEAPKKRGRASRELGALLLDAKGNGRGRKAAGLQAHVSDSVALAAIRGTTEPGVPVDGVIVEPSEALGARVEGRMTRSRASGRLAGKTENLDVNSLDGAGSQDVSGKRTGKRSAPKKSGRLGWGNGLENGADGVTVAGQSPILPDKAPAEGQIEAGLETGQGDKDQSKESEKGSEGKSGGRVKNTRGKGKRKSSEGGSGQVTGCNPHNEESHTAGITTDITKDIKGLETQCQINEVLITAPSAGTLSNLGVQESEAVEPAKALESDSGGRRRSNRQKAKIGVQPEAEPLSGYNLVGQSKLKQQRKSASSANELPQIPSGSQEPKQEVGSSEEVAGHLKAPAQNLSRNVGDDVEGVGSLDSSKEVRAKVRTAPKAKSTTRKAPQKRGKKNVEVSCTLEGPSNSVLGSEPVPSGVKIDITLSLKNETSTIEPEIGKESCGNVQTSASNRLEKIREESCLDTSKSDLRFSLSEQAEDFAKPFEVLDGNISQVTEPGNGVDSALVSDREAVVQQRIEEGGNKLIKEIHAEKLQTCGSSPGGELVTVFQVNSKAEVDGRNCVSMKSVGVNTVVDREAGGSADIAVKSEKGVTIVVETCNMNPCVRGEDVEFAKDHGRATKTECGLEQNTTVQNLAEAIPSAKDEGVVDTDRKAAVKKPSKVEAGRLGRSRKGVATKMQQVNNGPGSEACVKPKGPGRKRATTKQNSADEAAPLDTGDNSVVEVKTKESTASRRGKRKLNNENVVGSVAPCQGTSLEPSKDNVVDDVNKNNVTVSSEKTVKSRQKGKNTRGGLEGGTAKKRRKTEKLEGPQLDNDPCSVAMAVNASSEGPIEGLPVGSGCELKAPQRGKAGQRKSQKAVSGKKATKKIPVGDKSKQRKKPAHTTAKLKGATVKVFSTIKDQSSQETPPAATSKSAKPKVGRVTSNLQSDLADHCAVDDGKAGGEEKGQVAVGSASLNQETDVNVANTLQSEEGVRDVDGGAVGEDVSSGVTEGGENKGSEKGIDSTGAETGAARKSWVLCDDCNKWRCIPVELADLIESTNARWSCRENPDKEFQDCLVPQEKSNAEINAELEISEVSVCDEGDDTDAVDSKSMNLGAANEDNKPAVWKRIRRNIFQHRRRKVLEIDEMMVCQCKPPEDGSVGCGENCLNRMLSIECVAEQCPCGEACSNQQFQNRTYAPIEMYRCGRKGFGLKLAEHVPKGTFIIEYVGEVLDVSAFEARQQEYARKGQKHFYFMTLNTNEVIDACSKGNFGRFINHSCEPNCRTEKWMVNGEVCIGLFAVRDIAKDEEVTFDYNYVRVCGAAAKKCECGSSQCRGFIGGDPLTPKAVLESDSEDEEDLEPVMVENSEDEDAYVNENKLAPCKKPRAEAEFQETMPVRTIGIKRKLNILKEKSPSVVKRFKASGSARRSTSGNYRGLTLDISGGRHESSRTMYFSDVQEKLDEMLDRNGGLRKRRDAAKQYLKLLVLTSASGDSRNDATACSVRDLSVLLEALLKTTSKTVLSDIMNKNGLRMLHNLIKQLRKQWDKTPILRKLIKVLDLLASVRVLTTDLITSGPPCSGMESFSDSLFELTRHKDTEVVHMVRRFRNRWMPPRIWDQHYRGYEKPFSMQSSSVAVMQQSEQLNSGSNMFQSPQHPKQVSMGSEVSRPGSSEPSWPQGSSLLASQSQHGLPLTEDGVTLKDVKSSVKVSELGQDSTPGVTQPTAKSTRKRPSRWDAPAKVEKASKGPADPSASTNQSDAEGIDSGKQTTFSIAHVSQGSVQVSSEGSRQITSEAPSAAPQAFKQAIGPPVPQSVWPFSTSSGFQDSPGLPSGGISGQLQMGPRDSGSGLHHSHTQLVQGMPPTQHTPGANAMQQMLMGLPSTHVGLQHTPNSNAIQFGPTPLQGRCFPQGPPIQMGPGVMSAQVMHGSTQQVPMGTVPAAPGYPREPRPPPMPPTAPYGQWRPPPGAPNFVVAHAFPGDRSQMHPMPIPWPLQRVDDGVQRMSASDEVKSNKEAHLPAGAEAEPEPPVPGLSPRPPPPGEGSTPIVWTDSGSQSCQEFYDMSETGYYQAQWMPPHYMKGQAINQEYYGSNPYTRDATWGYPCGEYWETPEGEGFREDVFALVSKRVHKHHKLRTRDLEKFCSKMADVIVRKEIAKYIEHRNQGIEKIIMKTKLIEKVDSYVDNQVGVYLKKLDKSHRG